MSSWAASRRPGMPAGLRYAGHVLEGARPHEAADEAHGGGDEEQRTHGGPPPRHEAAVREQQRHQHDEVQSGEEEEPRDAGQRRARQGSAMDAEAELGPQLRDEGDPDAQADRQQHPPDPVLRSAGHEERTGEAPRGDDQRVERDGPWVQLGHRADDDENRYRDGCADRERPGERGKRTPEPGDGGGHGAARSHTTALTRATASPAARATEARSRRRSTSTNEANRTSRTRDAVMAPEDAGTSFAERYGIVARSCTVTRRMSLSSRSDLLDIRVLGPLEVHVDGEPTTRRHAQGDRDPGPPRGGASAVRTGRAGGDALAGVGR